MKNFIMFLCVTIIFYGCNTEDWLSEKSQKNFVVPETLIDYQAIIDDQNWTHNVFSNEGLVGSDDFYVNDEGFNAELEETRNIYSWNKQVWINGRSGPWNNFYSIIFKANTVIEGLSNYKKSEIKNIQEYNNILGQAFFYRAIAYYSLSQIFCKTYDSKQAKSDLGLPLRVGSDVNVIYQRSNLQDTYQFILNDIESAINLLPVKSKHNRRPNRVSAYSLFAKVNLVMEDYEKAFHFAQESLNMNPSLLDFNSAFINMNKTYRFESNGYNHPEILFFAKSEYQTMVLPYNRSKGFVSNDLYQQYSINDLRRSAFFVSSGEGYKYRGSYTGSLASFCGIANNEIYLIFAESGVRIGKNNLALQALNNLLSNRYITNTFIPYSNIAGEELLQLILREKRKELIGVGNIRWEDIRRLNKDSRFQIALHRVINSVEYTLLPNDKRYVFPIPEEEVQSSGIIQNLR